MAAVPALPANIAISPDPHPTMVWEPRRRSHVEVAAEPGQVAAVVAAFANALVGTDLPLVLADPARRVDPPEGVFADVADSAATANAVIAALSSSAAGSEPAAAVIALDADLLSEQARAALAAMLRSKHPAVHVISVDTNGSRISSSSRAASLHATASTWVLAPARGVRQSVVAPAGAVFAVPADRGLAF